MRTMKYKKMSSCFSLSILKEHKIHIDDFGIIRHLETYNRMHQLMKDVV
jgi:hypothetical protein